MSIAAVASPEVVEALVVEVISAGLVPAELTGDASDEARSLVEVAAGARGVPVGVWRVVLQRWDQEACLKLRGSGVVKVARCSSCQTPIRWVTAIPNGKRLPLDVFPHPWGNITVVDAGKDLVEVHPRVDLPIAGRAYRGHFATCVSAHQHRRAKVTRLLQKCEVCRQPLHPALVDLGDGCHPNCDPNRECRRCMS